MSDDVIALASDHAGLALKSVLLEELRGLGFAVLDLGTHSGDSVDYPDYGYRMAAALGEGKARRGVVVCGSGLGISMAANRFPWVRAAPCHDVTTANVIAFGERLIGVEVARQALQAFLQTPFAGDRHARRVDKLGSPPPLAGCS
jgi:ribose 5-phosphate isomerase B